MARLELVLSDQEKLRLSHEAVARGVSMSALVKERVFGSPQSGPDDQLEDHEKRLARLEEMANL